MKVRSVLASIAVAALLLVVSTTLALAQWVSVTSDDGGFSLSFPAAADVTSAVAPDGLLTHTYVARSETGLYLMSWGEYAPTIALDTEAELAANRDNMVKAIGGELVASRRTIFQTAAGSVLQALDFTARNPDLTCRSIVIMDGQRVYQLAGCGWVGQDATVDIERFLGSFVLAATR